jgi:hypothetical protein
VLVGFAAEVDAARQANLLVCARFEPSRVVPLWPVGVVPAPGCGGDADEAPNQEHERKLQPGEIVWLPEGVLAGGKSRAEQSVWIRADREGQVKQEALPKVSRAMVRAAYRPQREDGCGVLSCTGY